MPAISFNQQFLDALLRGDKQQTTRKQTDRIKVGDICHLYIEQRNRITEKPLRKSTKLGYGLIASKIIAKAYPGIPDRDYMMYYAHFLGKVEITEVYDVLPINSCGKEAWAKHDGFDDFTTADKWFADRYGEKWMSQYWTVIRWHGWTERYFEPKP